MSWFSLKPPAAPIVAGLHRRRVMVDTSLSLDEVTTLVTQIKGVLNPKFESDQSLSNYPLNYTALTRCNFLIGTALVARPNPSREHLPLTDLGDSSYFKSSTNDFGNVGILTRF